MRLSNEDVALFYKLYFSLLLFANARLRVVAGIDTEAQLANTSIDDRLALREALFGNSELIAEFVAENPAQLSRDELDIVANWSNFLRGRFYLFRQLKKHAIFLTLQDDMKAYGVLAIADLFDQMAPFMPIVVHTVLLPFKGQIIYDGLMTSESIYFGPGIKRRLNESYNEAKAKYGIITSLDNLSLKVKEPDEAELLKYYLRSAKNQEEYWSEIQQLIRKSEKNRTLYFQEIGKYFAKSYAGRLRDLGIESGWFGILESVIIGSGKTRKEAETAISGILPGKKMHHVYFFQLKAKRSPR